MERRRLGTSDLNLSVIGLGTWAMGGGNWPYGWGHQEDEASIRTLYSALDAGINWLDTAPVYGFSHSETVIGKAIQGMTEKPLIATKCSRVWDDAGNITSNLNRGDLIAEVEGSLRRLGVEAIDLLQIHWPKPKDQLVEGWETIQLLIQQGKVRFGGVSNFSVKQMRQIQPSGTIHSLQPPYSMFNTRAEDELLDFCQEQTIGVIPYSPMQKGLLTGKISPARVEAFPENDHRRNDFMFQEPELSINLNFVESLRPLAADQGLSLAQLAVAWVLRHDAVTAAIVGGRKPGQVQEIVSGFNPRLDAEIVTDIDGLLKERKLALKELNENGS